MMFIIGNKNGYLLVILLWTKKFLHLLTSQVLLHLVLPQPLVALGLFGTLALVRMVLLICLFPRVLLFVSCLRHRNWIDPIQFLQMEMNLFILRIESSGKFAGNQILLDGTGEFLPLNSDVNKTMIFSSLLKGSETSSVWIRDTNFGKVLVSVLRSPS